MKKVDLQPLGDAALVTTGATLLSALLDKELKVLMSCGGRGICSTCHVRVKEGMDQLSPMGPKERRTLALVADTKPDSRLACQCQVYGDGIVVEVPEGMYIERADDLLSLLGSRAPENILHPITGKILIPKGKIITRTLLEQSRSLEQEVKRLREAGAGSDSQHAASTAPAFTASGIGLRPSHTQTTHISQRAVTETKSNPARPTPAPVNATPILTPPPASRTPVPPPPSRVESKPPSTPQLPNRPNDRGPTTPRIGSSPTDPALLLATAPVGPARSSESINPSAIHPGAQIDKYLLIECIGKGGAGVVYRALHTKLKTLVAVKFLRADVAATDGMALERLAREAQLLAQLAHPHVVRVLDFEDNPIRPYVVMEYVDGLTASDLIKQSGRVAPRRAVDIVLDIADGLDAARKIGIVHRDVKPGNILVTRSGGSKLVDLGLAVLFRPDAAPGEAVAHGNTQAEGTVAYMSPEAIQGNTVDHRSDIYSLGATLFHLVAGRLPFVGRSTNEVIMKHLHLPLPKILETTNDIPPRLAQVLTQMMAKDPGERYQDYGDLRRDLRAAITEET